MGEFIKAKHAWMIPTENGVVMEDNRDRPGMRPIYRIPADEVKDFKEKWDKYGIVFVPLYSGVTTLPSPVVNTIHGKTEKRK